MIGAHIILKHHRNNGQSSYLWRPLEINMQNNMRTIHVGIFHLFKKKKKKKKKNMLGIKTLILQNLTTETLLLSQIRLSFKNREIANFFIISHFSDQRRLKRVCAFS